MLSGVHNEPRKIDRSLKGSGLRAEDEAQRIGDANVLQMLNLVPLLSRHRQLTRRRQVQQRRLDPKCRDTHHSDTHLWILFGSETLCLSRSEEPRDLVTGHVFS